MKIRSAEFIISASSPKHFPVKTIPEIAFAGRSNVGKSSLINSLLNRKKLVKTSSTPGKTQLINFFMINDNFYFVDLPGYGFAKVPENVRQQWQVLIEAYLQERKSLRSVVLIVDSRHGPNLQDIQLKEWLEYYEVPVLVVANKIDKLKRSKVQRHLRNIRQDLGLSKSPLSHSSLEKLGRSDIWRDLIPFLKA